MEVIDLTDDASVKTEVSEQDDSSGISNAQTDLGGDVFFFKLRGRPIPWQRPKVNRYGATYNPQAKLLKRLKGVLAEQMAAAPLTGPVQLEVDFYFLRPRKHFQRDVYGNLVRKPDRPMHCAICRDIDNLAKLVLDALNGIAYVDDRQVVDVRLKKLYSDVKYYYDDNEEIEEYTNIRVFKL